MLLYPIFNIGIGLDYTIVILYSVSHLFPDVFMMSNV